MRSRSTVVMVVALAAAACGGSDDSTTAVPTPTTSAPAVTTTAPAPVATTAAPSPCQPADVQAASMADGMKDGAALRRPFAVALDPPVGNFRSVVAAEVDGGGAPAGDGQVGAWATPAAGASGLTIGLDDVARRYSTWGEAATEGSPIDLLRDQVAARREVAAAKACVTG